MPTPLRKESWYILDSDQILYNVHPEQYCSGVCVVHRPSAHRMRSFPLAFDEVLKAFYRTCKHGEIHQDPDERTYWTNRLLASQRKRSRERGTELVALESLNNWGCPFCPCGCCDLTNVTA